MTTQGMATIFKARDPHGGVVAIKSLGRDATEKYERFLREITTLKELSHPAIVRYLDSGTHIDGTPYLVMEWLEGQDLANYMRRYRMSLGATLTWAGRIAEALGAAHSRGIVHRDVKPANIFLPGGDVSAAKLIDFGIALVKSARAQLTATGLLMGTPAYMAPEQARGERAIDARADVFALGCVMYECLAGEPAFMATTPMAVLCKILIEPSPRLGDVMPDAPPRLDALLSRMLAKSAEERLGNAALVAAEIKEITAALGAEGHAAAKPLKSARPALTADERRWVSILVVAAAGYEASEPAESTLPTVELQGRARVDVPSQSLEFGGVRFERLGNGSLVTIVQVRGTATDQAASAANLALALRRELPEHDIALATGRALMRRGRVAGDTIERAVALLDAQRSQARPENQPERAAIWIDEVTAELLDGRYELHQDGRGTRLRGWRRRFEERLLLGRTTPFVGRRREISMLMTSIEECVDESVARALLVTGPPGSGKSRLMHELLRHIDERSLGVDVWVTHGDPMHEGSPLFLLADALRRAADIRDSEPISLRRAKLRTCVARAMAGHPDEDIERVIEFVGELIGAPCEPEGMRLRAARRDPRLMGDQIQRACEDLWQAIVEVRPFILVIDDLQWGDRASIGLLDRLLRNLAEAPFVIIACGRSDVHERFPEIWAERSLTEIRLSPLTRRACHTLVREILGPHIDSDRAARLVERAGGNAFYLEELLRSAASGRWDWPETVLAMVEMRLNNLEQRARQALRAASVFGHVFWRGGVRALVGEEDIDEWLERLVEQELILEARTSQFPGEVEYRFCHQLICEGAYAMLTDPDRVLGHCLAGAWLESVGESDPRAIAEQFERGRAPERALPYFVRAAEDALKRCDLEAAFALAGRGLACGAERATLGALHRIQADVLAWQGNTADAIRLYSAALEHVPHGSRAWYEVAGEAGLTLGKLGQYERVLDLVTSLQAAPLGHEPAEAESAAVGKLIALAKFSVQLFDMGKDDLAHSLLVEVESALAAGMDDLVVAAGLYLAHAYSLVSQSGDPASALEHMTRVIACFEELGDTRQICLHKINASYLKTELGLYDEAERELRSTAAAAAKLGLDSTAHHARRLLGLAIARNTPGRIAEAIEIERQVTCWFEAHNDVLAAVWTQVTLASLLIEAGDLDGAEAEARAAMAQAPRSAAAAAIMARVCLARGLAAAGLAHAEQAVELQAAPGSTEEHGELVRLVHAEAAHAAGDLARAGELIRLAHDQLMARAHQIGDPVRRRSFLQNVPDHARIQALHRAWRASHGPHADDPAG